MRERRASKKVRDESEGRKVMRGSQGQREGERRRRATDKRRDRKEVE